MGVAFMRRTVRRVRTTVGAHHALCVRENAIEIVLAHREADHADVPLAALQEGNGERVRLQLLSLCETAESLAVGRGVGVVADARDLDVIPPADELDLS